MQKTTIMDDVDSRQPVGNSSGSARLENKTHCADFSSYLHVGNLKDRDEGDVDCPIRARPNTVEPTLAILQV